MKKAKKLLTLALCLLVLFATLAVAYAVEARIIAEPCPYCGEDVRTSISYKLNTDIAQELTPCIHYTNGYDICKTYDVIEIHTCSAMDCSYREEIDTGEQVVRITTCRGFD